MMTTPRKIALALVAAGAVGFGAWFRSGKPVATGPLDAVPADAFVAIDIDVAALRKSGALLALFGDTDEQSLTSVCGFDPVDRMQELVFTVPEGSTGDFGVAVRADVTQDDLVRCANEIVKARGGDPTSETVSYGSYTVVTPRQTSSDSTKPPRSLAVHAGSPILVGPRAWLERMVDATDAVSAGRGSAGEHATLRRRLTEGHTPPPTFLLTGTVILEKSVREKLKAEMAAEVGPGKDSGTAMMLGVLGMSSGVLGLYERGDEVRAVVDLHCEEEPQCAEVQKLVAKVRGEWAKMPELRAFGLGPVLEHLEVDHQGTWLEVRAGAATPDVVRWAKLFLASKPIVATPTVATADAVPAARVAPVGGASADVPSQTVKITVPEGLAPGQPFTVRMPMPGPSSSGRVVRNLTVTVPTSTFGSAPSSPPP